MAVSAGFDYCAALGSDGRVWTWGYNGEGQLGDGTQISQVRPVQVKGIADVAGIACGSNYMLALCEDGRIWAWGSNFYGILGNGTLGKEFSTPLPAQIPALGNVVAVSAGDGHCLAIDKAGQLWGWGCNTHNELGSGEPFPEIHGPVIGPEGAREYLRLSSSWYEPVPKTVPNPTRIRTVAAGFDHSLGIAEDGTVWAWGSNSRGQLGIGTLDHVTTPTKLHDLDHIALAAGGESHSLALTDDGLIWAWGSNESAELGADTAQDTTSQPVRVPHLTKIVDIAAGSHYSLAVDESGAIWAWGKNDFGQLGDGTTNDRLTPTRVMEP